MCVLGIDTTEALLLVRSENSDKPPPCSPPSVPRTYFQIQPTLCPSLLRESSFSSFAPCIRSLHRSPVLGVGPLFSASFSTSMMATRRSTSLPCSFATTSITNQPPHCHLTRPSTRSATLPLRWLLPLLLHTMFTLTHPTSLICLPHERHPPPLFLISDLPPPIDLSAILPSPPAAFSPPSDQPPAAYCPRSPARPRLHSFVFFTAIQLLTANNTVDPIAKACLQAQHPDACNVTPSSLTNSRTIAPCGHARVTFALAKHLSHAGGSYINVSYVSPCLHCQDLYEDALADLGDPEEELQEGVCNAVNA